MIVKMQILVFLYLINAYFIIYSNYEKALFENKIVS
jgi:hypothetical protein